MHQQAALIVAGGTGTRMGSDLPKQFLLLAGKPILLHTLEAFYQHDPALPVVITLPGAWIPYMESLLDQAALPVRPTLIAGGATRTDSVQAGLETLAGIMPAPSQCWVAIHDGVRPLITPDLIGAAYTQAAETGAAVVCVPVKASIRVLQPDGTSQAIPREQFYEVQTPQTFRLDLILHAYHHRPDQAFTDDASLYELTTGPVSICPGSYDNLKVTTPEDMYVAEMILKRRTA
ncbi:MAG: 2-C-methyl-D-erythritol 4-phosphate cytidylyltransferase [Bacteroidia bacterium]|nr:2-C-methyl-D-erythritol 4-phosphate cytidylyltransferase [Bacteroidia bacterium]